MYNKMLSIKNANERRCHAPKSQLCSDWPPLLTACHSTPALILLYSFVSLGGKLVNALVGLSYQPFKIISWVNFYMS